jgi:arginase family enzyme
MDIRYYFKAVDFSKIQEGGFLKEKNLLGYLIEKNTIAFSPDNIASCQIAIIGAPFEENTVNKGTALAPDRIRKQLYRLSITDPRLKIVDFGNLKRGKGKNDIYFALRDIIDLLKDNKVTVIFLGGGQDLGYGIVKAFSDDSLFQITTIDPSIDLKTGREPYNSSNYLSKVIRENREIFNINFVGFQSYFVTPKLLSQVSENFETIRLGKLREDLSEIEPILRDTDFLSFDISAIRMQDAPAYWDGSPNGLAGHEACQISRYAGISNRLKVFGLFEVNPKKDRDEQTLKLSAQIIWYFLEGFSIRRNDNPLKDRADFIQYNVEMDEATPPIIFWRHSVTNRWWMQLAGPNEEKVLIACSENDYKQAAKKEIPTKWIKYLRKTDNLLK